MPNSILYLPDMPGMDYWLDQCGLWCAQRRYPVVGVVHTWDAAVEMVFDGRAGIVVAGRRDHLPMNRSPRLEIVTEDPMPSMVIAQRRPARRVRV